MSEFDYEKMGESMARALRASGFDGKSTSTGGAKPKDAKELDVFIQHLKQMNSQSNKWNDAFKKNIGQIKGVSENLEELDAQIEKTVDVAEKDILAKKKEAVVRAATNAVLVKDAMAVAAAFNTATKSTIAGTGKLTKELLSGSSSVDFAASAMTTGLDIAGTAANQLSQTAGNAGAALMGAGGTAKVFGAALMGASAVLGTASAATGILKFGVEVLGGEVNKTIKAFETLTGTGVLYAKGMDDVLKYSGQAGLTMEQFSNVVKNNAAVLAESGYTVTDASKIMAGVTGNLATNIGKSGLTLRRELQNLGYGFEEQANLVAQLTGDLKKSGGTATNGQMAQATLEMGKNMRIVADIMGQDAKAKMEQAKKESEQYAFDAKLRELAKKNDDPGLFKRVQAGLSLMDATQRRAVIQATVLGGAVTDAAANVYGYSDAARQSATAILNGASSIETIAAPMAAVNDQLAKGTDPTMAAISAANIAAGSLGELATAADNLGQQAFVLTTENLAKAARAASEASAPASTLQNNVVAAADTMQKFQVDMQNMMLKPMEDFSKIMEKVLDEMRKAVGELATVASAVPGTWDKFKAVGSKALEGVVTGSSLGGAAGLGIGAVGGLGIASMATAPAGAAVGAGAGAIAGGIYGAGKGIYDVFFGSGKANGGIASGPTSGYLEKLHGTELVLPLTAQGTIKEGTLGHVELLKIMAETESKASVSTATTSTVTAQSAPNLSELVVAMSALLSTAKEQLDKQDEMIRVMADNRDNTERLYNAMS